MIEGFVSLESGISAVIWLVGGLVIVLFLAGSRYLINRGRYVYGQGKRVASIDPVNAADISSDQETVAVTGTVRATDSDGTFSAPFSDEDAVISWTSVSERRRSSGRGSNTTSLHSEWKRRPFRIEDHTGSVRVDPHEDAYHRIEQERFGEDGRSDRPPEVQEWIDRTGAVPDEPDDRRQYTQSLISVGETATVLGKPREIDGEWGETTIELVGGDNPEEMVVTDLDEGKLRSSTATRGVLMIVGGAIIGLLSVPMVLAYLFMLIVLLVEFL